ncbi:MAG: WD40 repeat domain-containing protein, partial [Planctomycetota bacterium]
HEAIDVHRFRDGPSSRLFACSPDGRLLVFSDDGREFRRIEVDTGVSVSVPLEADVAEVSSIRFSATGRFLVLVHKNGALSVLDAKDLRMVRRIVDPPVSEFHPTGPYDLFLWSPDPETPARRVVDLQRGTDVGERVDQRLRGASQWIADTTGRLVVLDGGQRVQVVELAHNETLYMDEPQDADRQVLAISAHGCFVASAGRTVRFWDVRNELLQWELASPRGDRAVAIAFNEHEDRAAIGYRSGLVRIVDVADRRVLTSAMDVRAMPAQGGHDRGPLRIRFDTAVGEVACVGFEQVSRWVAPAEGKPGVPRVPSLPGELRLAEGLSKSAIVAFRIAYHPRGRFLLTSGAVSVWGAVTVWDTWSETEADTGNYWHPYRGGDEPPRELLARLVRVSDSLPADLVSESSPSVLAGRSAFVGSRDGTIAMWDVEAHIRMLTLVGHEGAVVDLDFDPIDGTLASVSEDGTVRLWHTMPVAARRARASEAAQRGDFLWEIVRRHRGRFRRRSEIADRIRADRSLNDADRDAAVELCLRGY